LADFTGKVILAMLVCHHGWLYLINKVIAVGTSALILGRDLADVDARKEGHLY
jgi:hypothetical protein